MPADADVSRHIEEAYRDYNAKMQVVVCALDADYDTSFGIVRRKECSMGNFLADIMRKQHNADCAILNAGNIRSDRLFPKDSTMTLDAWMGVIPFTVKVCLAQVSGKILLEVLENSVSKLPALDGRFLQVSYIRFTYDVRKPPGSRVVSSSVVVNQRPLDLNCQYRVAVPDYTLGGKDGFEPMLQAKVLVDPENAPELKDIVTDTLQSAVGRMASDEAISYSDVCKILTPETVR